MTTATAHKTNLHFVIEAKRDSEGQMLYRSRTAPLPWGEAQAKFDRLDRGRTKPMHDHYFMVRSIDDPRWSPLVPRAFKPSRNRRAQYAIDADVRAAKFHAQASGIGGKPTSHGKRFSSSGGWLYSPNGRVICQGWASFATLAKANGWITPGPDGEWFAAVGPWFIDNGPGTVAVAS